MKKLAKTISALILNKDGKVTGKGIALAIICGLAFGAMMYAKLQNFDYSL
jgi:hypothetical protein